MNLFMPKLVKPDIITSTPVSDFQSKFYLEKVPQATTAMF